jgi:cysteinyl-tRNA synthetase
MCDELANDFNSAGAMGHFFSFLRAVKAHRDELSEESLREVHAVIRFVQDSLGLVAADPRKVLDELKRHEQDTSSTGVDSAWIEALIAERKAAKDAKNWSRADEIRKEIAAKNIVLKDNPDGTTTWSVVG